MKKKTMLVPLMLLMVIALVGTVWGADAFVTPGASATASGSYLINISTDLADSIYNCTVVVTSATSGSSSTTLYAINNSVDATYNYATVSFTSTGVKDASDYVFTATCYNSTNNTESLATASRTSVTVDNTVPSCSQSTLASNTEYDIANKSFTVTVTCDNATSATGAFDGNTYSMTESSDVCTYDIGSIPTMTYDSIVFTTSDGLNTTACTAVTKAWFSGQRASPGISVDVSGVETAVTGTSSKDKLGYGFLIILIVAIIGLIIKNKNN